MKSALSAFALGLFLGGCVTGTQQQYVLTGGETGVFKSANAGRPIPIDRIKGLDEAQIAALFGVPALDRKDGPARLLRYQSDGCMLFITLYRNGGTTWRASYADAYDTHLRPLPTVDQCAGSVAAQKRTA